MAGETYYDVLKVTPTASVDDIKKSYISLVKQYHPDKAEGDEEKQERYSEYLLKIMEAWEVLSDSEKKAAYDTNLTAERKAGVIVEASTESRGKKMSGMSKRTGDIETEYPISLALAAYGKGKLPLKVAGERIVVKVYPGVRRYRIEGKGVPAEGGKRRGDLYVNLKILPEEGWELDEETNDLICTLKIPAKIAANGGQMPLELLMKRAIKITVPPGIETGARFKPCEGKGLGVVSHRNRGDIVIVADVVEKKGLFGFLKK